MVLANRLNKLNLIRDVDLTYDVGGLYQTDNKQIRYKRDSYGLRGNYGTPGQIDILTVGGSTTDQRFISEGATWQDVLHHVFAAHGKTVHVANAGVDGQSTYGHIKDFDWWFPYIPNLKARYFLFYLGINDFHKGREQ
jgi:lysophospholipase L1-like esterase